ncbi:hypothetical protein NFI96_006419 [Prochilodus magdalenae]|nr:hypothetical protein NFI96_006419 [Prochilodus magdalenae]
MPQELCLDWRLQGWLAIDSGDHVASRLIHRGGSGDLEGGGSGDLENSSISIVVKMATCVLPAMCVPEASEVLLQSEMACIPKALFLAATVFESERINKKHYMDEAHFVNPLQKSHICKTAVKKVYDYRNSCKEGSSGHLHIHAIFSLASAAHTVMQAKTTDLESRSRRNNIRIIGLPEEIEGQRPTTFFAELLSEVFGDAFPSPPEVDRAHRALSAKPRTGGKPRTVIIRLHHFQNKERIIQGARARRGKLQFRGKPIFIFEDYAPDVLEQRRDRQAGVAPTLSDYRAMLV